MKSKTKLRKITPVVMGVCMLTFVAACGNDNNNSSSAAPTQQEQTREGTFSAVLTPENAGVSTAAGTATISSIADDFRVIVTLNGAPVSAHAQHLHTGSRCPTPADDTNNDGFVDAAEAQAVYGPVLVPFDGDLNGQDLGSGGFPTGANYVYDETASYSQLLADLQLPDPDPTSGNAKLPAGQELLVENMVVNIHGVPATVVLPATVAGGNAALPVACGVVTRVSDGGTVTGGTATGGTATGGTATGGTATGGTATGGTATGGTATGGTATGGTATGGTATGGTATGGTATGGTATGGTATGGTATGGTAAGTTGAFTGI